LHPQPAIKDTELSEDNLLTQLPLSVTLPLLLFLRASQVGKGEGNEEIIVIS